MKKLLCLVLCCLFLAAPIRYVHGETQGEKILSLLNTEFAKIMDEGGKLFSCIGSIPSLTGSEQFKAFQTADGYTAKMKESYLAIIEACSAEQGLDFLVYQVRLLEKACPPAITGMDSTSLANQSVLYQLYLQQVSSSFSYLAIEMDRLSGKAVEGNAVSYFAEVPEMPTPDSVIFDITFDSKKTESGVVQYMYLLGQDETDASMNYNIYLSAVDMDESLRVSIEDTYCYVLKDQKLASAMMAGNDPVKGFFLIVSFQG